MMYDSSDPVIASRMAKADLYRALQLLGRTLVAIEAQEALSIEEHLLLGDLVDALGVCHALISQLHALEQKEGEHDRDLIRVKPPN
jgi:hypothetical protein